MVFLALLNKNITAYCAMAPIEKTSRFFIFFRNSLFGCGATLISALSFAAAPEEVDLTLQEAVSLAEIASDNNVSKNVYHVEMIVLAHKYDNGIVVDESWPHKNTLAFPRPLQVIKKNPEAELIIGTGDDDVSLDAAALMTQLDSKQKNLNDMAMQMRLRQGYRLLFHEAWFQQLESSSRSKPVFIEGGQWYDPYFELSGTVTLSVDRYLHVRTNLWLAEFTTRAEARAVPWHARGVKQLQANLPTREQALNRALAKDSEPRVSESRFNVGGESLALFEYEQANVANRGENLAEVVYVLEDSRRVNSKEYHYFDHPRFGVIVKLTPLSKVFATD